MSTWSRAPQIWTILAAKKPLSLFGRNAGPTPWQILLLPALWQLQILQQPSDSTANQEETLKGGNNPATVSKKGKTELGICDSVTPKLSEAIKYEVQRLRAHGRRRLSYLGVCLRLRSGIICRSHVAFRNCFENTILIGSVVLSWPLKLYLLSFCYSERKKKPI